MGFAISFLQSNKCNAEGLSLDEAVWPISQVQPNRPPTLRSRGRTQHTLTREFKQRLASLIKHLTVAKDSPEQIGISKLLAVHEAGAALLRKHLHGCQSPASTTSTYGTSVSILAALKPLKSYVQLSYLKSAGQEQQIPACTLSSLLPSCLATI